MSASRHHQSPPPPPPPSRRASDPTPLLGAVPAQRRRVSFCEETSMLMVESHRDIPEIEKAAIWYTENDFAEIRYDMQQTVKLYRKLSKSLQRDRSTRRRFSASDAEDFGICVRGLEHLASRQVLQSRQEEQALAATAVLTLQSNPMAYSPPEPSATTAKLGGDDYVSRNNVVLAVNYANVTRIARERALLAARTDATEALNYLRIC